MIGTGRYLSSTPTATSLKSRRAAEHPRYADLAARFRRPGLWWYVLSDRGMILGGDSRELGYSQVSALVSLGVLGFFPDIFT